MIKRAPFKLMPKGARQGDRWAHISCVWKKTPLPDGTVVPFLTKGETFKPGRNRLKRAARAHGKGTAQYREVMAARRRSQRGEA